MRVQGMPRGTVKALAIALVTMALVAGCVNNSAIDEAAPLPNPAMNAEARALLPPDVARSNVLRVVTAPGTPPFSFRPDKNTIAGSDIELVNRLAEVLGLDVEVTAVSFAELLPSVSTGGADLAISSLFVVDERLRDVDFVTYMSGGTSWLVNAGSEFAELSPEDFCGRAVAVIESTYQALADLPGRSQQCRDQGAPPIEIVPVANTSDGIEALLLANVEAFVADSPVVQSTAEQSKGRLVGIGAPYDVLEYGIAVSQDEPGLSAAMQAALRDIIDDGTYGRLLGKWGIDGGSIPSTRIRTSRP